MSSHDKDTPRRLRRGALLLHRYVGLSLVLFLVVAGLTGSLLAFNESLDAVINPELFYSEPSGAFLDPFEVAERVDETSPVDYRIVHFAPEENRALVSWVEEAPGVWRQWFVNPYRGEVQGSRTWGDIGEGTKNLMPFIYRLHFSLGLGTVGTVIFGIAALLWTLDCFVSIYLTLPTPKRSAGGKRWISRWGSAWRFRANNIFGFVFNGHRAGGLWIWGVLLVFAWSAVGLNLPEVQRAVTATVVSTEVIGHEALPQLSPPFPEPALSLREAHARGREAMAEAARERRFEVEGERMLYYAEDHGVYGYVVESSLDISEFPWTEVYIDGQSGETVGFYAPTGIAAGNTLIAWLNALHTASVFGPPYRVFVMLLGLAVSFLSVTGVWIWWKKRAKRRRSAVKATEPTPTAELAPQTVT